MTTRAQIVEEARSWIGVRWRHQGRTRVHGIDCIGLVARVGEAFGMVDMATVPNDYGRRTECYDFLIPFQQHMERIPLKEAKEGDVVILREHAYPCHCGILGSRDGDLTLIHAYLPRHQVMEERYSAAWIPKSLHAFRFKGLED